METETKQDIFGIIGTICFSDSVQKLYVSEAIDHASAREFLLLLESPLIVKILACEYEPRGIFKDKLLMLVNDGNISDEWATLIEHHLQELPTKIHPYGDEILARYLAAEIDYINQLAEAASEDGNIEDIVECYTVERYERESMVIEKLYPLFYRYEDQHIVEAIRYFLEGILLTNAGILERSEFKALLNEKRIDLRVAISWL